MNAFTEYFVHLSTVRIGMTKEKGPAGDSEMALAVLMFTSVAGTERDSAVRVDDPVGPRLFRWSDGKYRLGKTPSMHPLFRRIIERSDPGTYGYLAARLRCMDDVVKQEAADGIDQLVILGAGYDTRAYRMREHLEGVRVFEVDVPLMSQDKRARIGKALGSFPANVNYVEVDFLRQDFLERLSAHDYDSSARTLFVLSGVSMYLPEAVVFELFSKVADSPARSSIVFDYCFEDALTHPERYRGASTWISRASKAGEGLLYGIGAGEVGTVVAGQGLQLASHCSPEELTDRYLRRTDGTIMAVPYDFAAVAHAVVAS